MKIVAIITGFSLILSGCAAVVASEPPEPPPDKFIGMTKWVNPKFPVYVCSTPPSGGSMGHACKAAPAGSALTIKRALFVYNYDIPIPNGYAVEDSTGAAGFIRDMDPILMLDEAQKKKRVAERAACDKRGGVSVGMTAIQVRATCWGKPTTINETITSSRKHEQWVYGSNQYLYFDNGVLTSIQTSRQ